MDSVQREEESLWLELEVFVKQLGFQPTVNESWMMRMVAVGRGESEVETEMRLHVVNLYISVIDQK